MTNTELLLAFGLVLCFITFWLGLAANWLAAHPQARITQALDKFFRFLGN